MYGMLSSEEEDINVVNDDIENGKIKVKVKVQ